MEPEKQNQATVNQDVSPLAKDMTYGEKQYDFVFNKMLNFWVNLTTSAAFSLWTAHSMSKIKLPGMKEAATPRTIQENLADKIENSFIIRSMAETDKTARRNRAFSMAETLTLVTPGHFIMIPSVWLGAKIKPAFVRWMDKRHYGPGSENDPSLEYRHQLIDAEAKPTFLGAVVGRIGTVAMTQLTARFVGTDNNFVNKIGKSTGIKSLEESKGLNQYAGKIGDAVGDGIANIAPATTGKINAHLSEPRYTWSEAQRAAGQANGSYNRGVQNFIKYTAMDTLYTLVTAGSIHPIMRMVRKIPGMTYTNKPPVPQHIISDDGDVTRVKAPRNPLVERTVAASANDNAYTNDNELPQAAVSQIHHQARIHDAPAHAVQAG